MRGLPGEESMPSPPSSKAGREATTGLMSGDTLLSGTAEGLLLHLMKLLSILHHVF